MGLHGNTFAFMRKQKNRIRHHAECGCKNIIKGGEKQESGHYTCSYFFAEWGEGNGGGLVYKTLVKMCFSC